MSNGGHPGVSRGHRIASSAEGESAIFVLYAVLRYDRRFDLNGEAVDEAMSEDAKEQARQVLAARAARLRAQEEKTAANNPAVSSLAPAEAVSGG